ncbi:PEGA domain-containing protein [candidate division GN15 bacterium]|nr:PEGA domain-containing protein [candidate division GN15 bacterium]
MDTGRYVVRVENDRSREKSLADTLAVLAEQTVSRWFSFTMPSRPEPTPEPPEPRLGEVRVGSQPRGASILINGEMQRHKTNYTFTLKPGRHIIGATLEYGGGNRTLMDTLVVIADSVHKVVFDFEQ